MFQTKITNKNSEPSAQHCWILQDFVKLNYTRKYEQQWKKWMTEYCVSLSTSNYIFLCIQTLKQYNSLYGWCVGDCPVRKKINKIKFIFTEYHLKTSLSPALNHTRLIIRIFVTFFFWSQYILFWKIVSKLLWSVSIHSV